MVARRLPASCKGKLNDFFLLNKVFLDAFTLQAVVHDNGREALRCACTSKSVDEKLEFVTQWMAKIESHINTFSDAVGAITARFAELEHKFDMLAPCHCALRQELVLSRLCFPAGSWLPLSRNGGSTAARSHGPGHVEDNRSVRQESSHVRGPNHLMTRLAQRDSVAPPVCSESCRCRSLVNVINMFEKEYDI